MGRELKGCRFPEVGAVAVAPWRCGAETQLRPRKESSRGVFYRLGGGGSGLALRTVELIGERGRAEEIGTGLLPGPQGFPELKAPDLSPPTLNSGLELLPSRAVHT